MFNKSVFVILAALALAGSVAPLALPQDESASPLVSAPGKSFFSSFAENTSAIAKAATAKTKTGLGVAGERLGIAWTKTANATTIYGGKALNVTSIYSKKALTAAQKAAQQASASGSKLLKNTSDQLKTSPSSESPAVLVSSKPHAGSPQPQVVQVDPQTPLIAKPQVHVQPEVSIALPKPVQV